MSDQESIRKATDRFEAFLKERGMRRTAERTEILKMAYSLKGHFDVDELHRALDRGGFHVSMATAYSACDLMYEAGLLRKHLFDGQHARYEVAEANHVHLICLQCGKITEAVQDSVVSNPEARCFAGFQVSYFSATFYGICSSCTDMNSRNARKGAPKVRNKQQN